MTFEEALRTELITVKELNNKVFPLVAPEKTVTPYLVYRRGLTDFEKTLAGISRGKVDGSYELVLVTDNYSDIQRISSGVIDKLISFLGREIGFSGPCISNMTVKIIGDTYEPEIDKFRCDMQISISY